MTGMEAKVSKFTSAIDQIAERVRQTLTVKDAAREQALPLAREVIRLASQAIRAVHRQEFDQARQQLQSGRKLLDDINRAFSTNTEFLNAGFIFDAQKEFAEGSIVLALVTGAEVPDPQKLGIDVAAYLNGLGEAVGELRRYLLDGMRQGNLERGEELLSAMDDIYNVLVTMDFPDAVTGGLRRTTDMVRGILERTRSDLTLTIRQSALEHRLDKFEQKLQ